MTIQELSNIEQQLFNIQLKLQCYMQGTKTLKLNQDNAIINISKARDSINYMIGENNKHER